MGLSMSKLRPSGASSGNRLLSRLPDDALQRLLPRLEPVLLPFKMVLYEARAPIDYVYFPTGGVVSAITLMRDGRAIEMATIGKEGVAGLGVCLGVDTSPSRMIIQVAGDGLRIEADALREETEHDGPIRRLLLRYFMGFVAQVSQAVACNGLHPLQQRCCRWLLMTQDRVEADALPITQEFLAIMLGVRRASITDVLGPLQAAGLIRSSRGNIHVLDRRGLEAASCECYRTVQEEFDWLFPEPEERPG